MKFMIIMKDAVGLEINIEVSQEHKINNSNTSTYKHRELSRVSKIEMGTLIFIGGGKKDL